MTLYRIVDIPDLIAPVCITAFDGWVDAGSAATTAIELLATDADPVATFDADRLYDYRARRPTLEIVGGRPSSLEWPELTLRAARVGTRDVLILSGPEPDFVWRELCDATMELAERLGVVEWIGIGAIPAAVPHTRPVPILGTESRPGLLRGGVVPGPDGVMRVPAAAVSVLDRAAADAGLPTVGYFAQIPHYLSGPYPAASIELLRTLGSHLGEEVDLGTLPEDARQLASRLDVAASAEDTTRAYVERLESMVDEARRPSGDDLISEIERFLRERGEQAGDRD